MDLKELIKPMVYKWRVQSFSKNKPLASCVAYIDARQVQDRLDEVCGPENWQNEYYTVGNLLFCKIGIKDVDGWVWKSDTGVESNIEKDKGHASDAFKRAAVQWGIGRFLYALDIEYVTANEIKTNNNFPHVIDDTGKRIWDLTKHINSLNAKKTQRVKSPAQMPKTTPPTPEIIDHDKRDKQIADWKAEADMNASYADLLEWFKANSEKIGADLGAEGVTEITNYCSKLKKKFELKEK